MVIPSTCQDIHELVFACWVHLSLLTNTMEPCLVVTLDRAQHVNKLLVRIWEMTPLCGNITFEDRPSIDRGSPDGPSRRKNMHWGCDVSSDGIAPE